MSEAKVKTGKRKAPPARTPEEFEKRCINLAEQQAEEMLAEGKAPTQVLLHYLKLGTSKAELEKTKLEHETVLLSAKTDALKTTKETVEAYQELINVIKGYSGNVFKEEVYDEE